MIQDEATLGHVIWVLGMLFTQKVATTSYDSIVKIPPTPLLIFAEYSPMVPSLAISY